MKSEGNFALLVVCVCVTTHVVHGVLAADRSRVPCTTSCSIQSDQGLVRSGDVCSFKYYPKGGCLIAAGSSSSSDDDDDDDDDSGGTREPPDPPASPPPPRKPGSGSLLPRLQLSVWPFNAANAAVDFTIPVNHSRMVMVVINGVTTGGEGRCVTVEFSQRPGWSAVTLRASCLTLPHGRYNLTVLTTSPSTSSSSSSSSPAPSPAPSSSTSSPSSPSPSPSSPSSSSSSPSSSSPSSPSPSSPTTSTPESHASDNNAADPSKRRSDSTAGDRLAVIARHSFALPYAADRYGALGRSTRHRSKRVGKRTQLTTEDLFLGPPATSGPAACPCYHCLEPNHTYHTDTAFLQFSFTVNTSEACCANCSKMNLVLYQYVNMDDALMCDSLNFTPQVVSGLRLVNTDKNITQGPVDYPNIGTGCYAFRLRPSVNPSPIYHGFLWLKAKVNVTNMDDWNTTFFLQPDHGRGSLEVRWTAPSYPFNFSSYGLQLWHNKNSSITCRGETIYKGPIVVIPKNEKIYLTSTNYTFQNLSQGWYCVRVTPIDDRCPPDGCQPRSSLAKQLLDLVIGDPEEVPESITPGVLGAGAAILLAGVLLACLVIRCRSSRGVFGVSYTKVHVNKKLNEGGVVLLVWTKTGTYGEYLAPVVLAFKKTLLSYCKFRVYDYLDLMSLPPEHRQNLLASPAAWLDTVLSQHHVKIIIIGSEGARQRQLEGMCGGGGGGVRHTTCEHDDPLDVFLFPYLLRRLQDRPDLAGDYARVFHVRFSDICNEKAELEGVVSWTRYRLPEHLRSLTLSLHGISEEAGCDLEDPPADLIAELNSAMANHPMHGTSRNYRANRQLPKDDHTPTVPLPPLPPLPTPPSSEASCDGHSSDAGPDSPDVPLDGCAVRLGKL